MKTFIKIAFFSSALFFYTCDNIKCVETQILKECDAFEEPGACYFIPPANWGLVDPKHLLDDVKIMVKGQPKSANHIPPSINLALEETQLSLNEYLTLVEQSNQVNDGRKWAMLGTIKTNAGNMALTQLDLQTKWGEVRMIQGIIVKNKKAFVVTATAQLCEFSQFYQEFQKALESFTINKDLWQMIQDKEQRKELKMIVKKVKLQWLNEFATSKNLYSELCEKDVAIKTFKDASFQETVWQPFQSNLANSYPFMSSRWHMKFLEMIKDELLAMTN
jgi:hypothetical protein